jgi:hypothetical protein
VRLATSRWLRRTPLWVPTFAYLADNRGKGPDEYQVEAVGEAGYEIAVILRVPSGEDACNYYRQALWRTQASAWWTKDVTRAGSSMPSWRYRTTTLKATSTSTAIQSR